MNPILIHHLLRRTASENPDNEAVILGQRSLNYGHLSAASSSLAVALGKIGVRPGDRVGIMAGKSLEAIVGLYGILIAGAAYVPIDPSSPSPRIRHILQNCGIKTLIASASAVSRLLNDDGNMLLNTLILFDGDGIPPTEALSVHLLEELISSGSTHNFPDARISSASPAYILHTSGSTGIPKGVVLSHNNAMAFVRTSVDYFGLDSNDRFSGHSPLHFDLSVFDLFCAAAVGAAVVLVPDHLSMFPVKLSQFIEETRMTVFNAVASVGALLASRGQIERFKMDTMRLYLFSGDVMPVKYLKTLMLSMPNAAFYNIYGQTEANSSTAYPVDDVPEDENWKIPIGKALPDFEAFVIGENGDLVTRPGENGELHIAGPTVGLGYWGDPEKSKSGFIQDPRTDRFRNIVYRTGDLVTLTKEGDLVYVGRRDHMIKSRGYRVQLDEIEAVLNTHKSVKEVVALAIPDETLGNRIVSCVVCQEGCQPEELALKEHCGRSLPPYMVPEMISFLESFPRTSTGKINRQVLIDRFITEELK